ncbi:MAG TPA: hypothetical protein VLW50_16045 [Streptosporangiaceae bacterium]|nr:hypothetical protein [Streptosporangiaceae bacterium]
MTVRATLAHGLFTVDPWDPSYGLAFGDELDSGAPPSSAQLDLDLEMPAGRWRPVNPDITASLPGALLFLDGVRRIDARIWVHGDAQPAPGIAASFAAGLVCCDSGARIAEVTIQRALFTAAAEAADIATRHGRYPARQAGASGPDPLSLALQRGLMEAEVDLAIRFRAQRPAGDDLLIVDGPLRGRTQLERTVGYVKTHHASYLPRPQAAVVASLAPGQRTPVFGMGTSWRRSAWYVRLPGGHGAPWSGVVRLECSADLPPGRATRLADLTARLLPPLASAPHKDPRAPQNLVPIGGLERELRRRLGDQQLLYRALRAAAVA